jgi:hypothetical protein
MSQVWARDTVKKRYPHARLTINFKELKYYLRCKVAELAAKARPSLYKISSCGGVDFLFISCATDIIYPPQAVIGMECICPFQSAVSYKFNKQNLCQCWAG